MNDLSKYKKIHKRTKLLYGVSDVPRLIKKSEASQHFYFNDFAYKGSRKDKKKKDNNSPIKDDKSFYKQMKAMFKLDYFIISMNNGWKAAFDNFILIVIGYTCFTTVLFVSFVAEKSNTLTQIDHMVTVFFGMDFVFNLMCEYQDPDTFQKVRDHKKIIMKYAKSGWMLLDFIATFPFDIVFNTDA
jgi:hypothetical protein